MSCNYKLVEPPALNTPCVWTGILFTAETKQAARLFQSGLIIQEFSPPITAGEHRVRQSRLYSLRECQKFRSSAWLWLKCTTRLALWNTAEPKCRTNINWDRGCWTWRAISGYLISGNTNRFVWLWMSFVMGSDSMCEELIVHLNIKKFLKLK